MKFQLNLFNKKQLYLSFVVSLIIVLVLSGTLLFIVSCSEGVNTEEANKILTSFSLEFPEGFYYKCFTQVPIKVTIRALDQNGEEFKWNGIVDLIPTNPNVVVEIDPETINLVDGKAEINVTFYTVKEQDEETYIKLRYQDIVVQIEKKIYIERVIPPIAGFSADVTEGEPPLLVKFQNTSTGHIFSWEWDFNNDGIVDSTDENPEFIFSETGNYTVSLVVKGPAGSDTETKSKYIKVGKVPIADFKANQYVGDYPLDVVFNNLSNGDIWNYEWDFNNDGIVDSNDENPQFTYNMAGYYTVKLTASGPRGSDITIKNYHIKVLGLGEVGDDEQMPLVAFNSCVFKDDDAVYIAYADYFTSKVTVMKYTTSGWEIVGDDGITTVIASGSGYLHIDDIISLYVDNGIPYVAFVDLDNYGKISVLKYDGNDWVSVGERGFSDDCVYHVSLFVSNGSVYAAYEENGIIVKKFNGYSWDSIGTTLNGHISRESLFVYNDTPYLAYYYSDTNDHKNKLSVVKYDGTDWVFVGEEGFTEGYGKISLKVDNGKVFVACSSIASVLKYDGSSWVKVGNSSFCDNYISYLSLSVYGGVPYVAFYDSSTNLIRLSKYDGTNWTVEFEKQPAGYLFYGISMCMSDGIPYISYEDSVDEPSGGYIRPEVLEYIKRKWDSVGHNESLTGMYYPTIFVYDRIPYVAFTDMANLGISVLKYNETDWVCIGDRGSIPMGLYKKIFVYEGTPYVAWQDGSNYNVSGAKYNGSSWEILGDEGFGKAEAWHISLSVDDNVPYVAFKGSGNKLNVVRYDGTKWVFVGEENFSPGEVGGFSLSVNEGVPYIAFRDYANEYKLTLMKFDGNSWLYVGNAGFTTDSLTSDSITLNFFNDVPYITCWENNNLCVYKYDNGNWHIIGDTGINGTHAYKVHSLGFYEDTVYLVYSSGNNGILIKYDGSDWVTLGDEYLSDTINDFSFFMYQNIPYVVYNDFLPNGTVKKFW